MALAGEVRSAVAPEAGRARWVSLAVVLTGVFMQLLDTTIVTVAIPSIQRDLAVSFSTVQLVLAGYSLTFACTLVIGGRLGDLYGRRRLFLIGMAGFILASAICGAAPSGLVLVLARLAQGLASGLMFPQVLAVIQVMFTPREQPKALGAYGASIGLATISGPVLGGALIAADVFGADWRTIFYINVPIGVLALCLAFRLVPESYGHAQSKLDISGAIYVAAGLFAFILPLVVGRDQGWPAWCFALILLSVPLLGAFVAHERRLGARPGSNPLVRLSLFRQRSFSVGVVLSLVFFAGVPSFFFVFILSLQAGFGYSAVRAGAVTLGFALLVAIGSARSSAVVKRLGTWTLALGSALLVVGMTGVLITLHVAGTGLHGYQLIPALALAGSGAGLFLAPVTGVIIAGLPQAEAGSASGVLATAQQIGAAVGVAIVGVLFFGFLGANADHATAKADLRLRSELTGQVAAADAQAHIVSGFNSCFDDRAHAKDPSALPASCLRMQERSAAAPPDERLVVRRAVQDAGVTARRDDFSRSLQQAIYWQIGVFTISLLLVLGLPKVKPSDVAVLPQG